MQTQRKIEKNLIAKRKKSRSSSHGQPQTNRRPSSVRLMRYCIFHIDVGVVHASRDADDLTLIDQSRGMVLNCRRKLLIMLF